MKRLIFNADDFGICQAANQAIVQSHQRGVLNSTSLLVNMPATQHAVSLWKDKSRFRSAEHPLEIGLHFCLTSGRPALPLEDVPLLTSPTGKFRHSFFSLWNSLRGASRTTLQLQIAAELLAQWQRALDLGITPTHLDSHQHVHMIPGVAEVVTDFAHQKQIPLRISRETPPRNAMLQHATRPVHSALGRLRISLLNHFAARAPFAKALPHRASQCIGIWHSGHMTLSTLLDSLRHLPRNSTTEVIVHPGMTCQSTNPFADDTSGDVSAADQSFWCRSQRATELQALTSSELAAAVLRFQPSPKAELALPPQVLLKNR
ncbi:MAG: ChbG/HpnK family deacetylase [Pirellulales bacterium]